MAFDGIICNGIVHELKSNLLLGKVDKIYQPEKDELVLIIHTKEGKKKLYLSAASNHMGAYLTDSDFQNPINPPSFCMLLRKHLLSGRITDIYQKDFERIIEIDFETRDELGFNVNKKLIVEIMGKHSNIILVDAASGKIMDCIKRVSFDLSRARQILPGLIYEYPPAQDKLSFLDATSSHIDGITSSKEILSRIQGISPLISEEIFSSQDSGREMVLLQELTREHDFCPRVYFKEDKSPLDFHILPIKSYEGIEFKDFESISQCIEYFYTHKESTNRVKQKSSDLHRIVNNLLKKLYLKKQRLLEDIQKAQNADKYKLFGELITANMHLIKKGDKKVNLLNYYTGENVDVALDELLSPSSNAQKYYKKYNKAKTAIVEKNNQLEETDEEIEYLESVLNHINLSDRTEDIDLIKDELIESGYIRQRKKVGKASKKPKIEPYSYTTSDGFKVLAGRNNKENDVLTLKKANRTDLWFHTKDIPGSHTILFCDGKEPSDVAIFEAAAIAAFHSKARQSENVPVDYTQVRYVKKPSGAKPGMVIFTDNKTVYVTPKLPK